MKKYIITTIILIFFFSLISCEKDYRYKYTGTWEFETETIKYTLPDHQETERDTIYYVGKIYLVSSNGKMHIQYTENNDIVIYIDKDGGIFSENGMGHGSCGKFENKNKVSFDLAWYLTDSILVHRINGTKKKGGKSE